MFSIITDMILLYSSGGVYSYSDHPNSAYAEGSPAYVVLFNGTSKAALN